jgi:hypothetical protein
MCDRRIADCFGVGFRCAATGELVGSNSDGELLRLSLFKGAESEKRKYVPLASYIL